jgi:hypothetical protein
MQFFIIKDANRSNYQTSGTQKAINSFRNQVSLFYADSDVVESVAASLGYGVGTLPCNYLGLPIGANMKRIRYWGPVIERFQNRLSCWKAKTLSFAGRVTLAKSVLGSLPSYFLSLFKAPKAVINTWEGLRRKFVWGGVGTGKKISWVKWDKLIRPKCIGGIGIVD